MALQPRESYQRVFQLLQAHHEWFSGALPLIASENIPSPAVKEAILSDFGNRYAEGWTGERVYAGCRYIDQVEQICIDLAKQLFGVDFADVRPISGVCANLVAYTTFTTPGDTMMALAIPAGGHISMGKKEFGGTAGAVRGLNVEYFPFDTEEMNIDIDATEKKIRKLAAEGKTPTLAMFGGSVLPFPHPIKELASILQEHGAKCCFDAAHVAGLVAGGQFQDPMHEGVDAMTCSTHKTLPGPQGGLILSHTENADKIKKATFPGNVSNHHLHHLAG
ncbi:aminotransferase class V-fold PLP-dependent enzyme, partial [Candidatus Bathyarchaeota archaeon]